MPKARRVGFVVQFIIISTMGPSKFREESVARGNDGSCVALKIEQVHVVDPVSFQTR